MNCARSVVRFGANMSKKILSAAAAREKWLRAVVMVVGAGVLLAGASSAIQQSPPTDDNSIAYACTDFGHHITRHGWPITYENTFDYHANPYLPCSKSPVFQWLPFVGNVVLYGSAVLLASLGINAVRRSGRLVRA